MFSSNNNPEAQTNAGGIGSSILGSVLSSPAGDAVADAMMPNKSMFPQLSWSTRIKYFALSLTISLVLAIIGIFLITVSLKTFALLYTLSTIGCLFSITFLVGFGEQFRSLGKPNRLIATGLLILCIILTLLASLKWDSAFWAVIFVICQFAAFIWYALSYIPFAHNFIQQMCGSCCPAFLV